MIKRILWANKDRAEGSRLVRPNAFILRSYLEDLWPDMEGSSLLTLVRAYNEASQPGEVWMGFFDPEEGGNLW